LATLLAEQIEFADIIILNKMDKVTKEDLKFIHDLVSKLNPTAKVYQSNYSKVALKSVLNTGLFNYENFFKLNGGKIKTIE